MGNIFMLWLEGVKILLSLLGLGVAMIVATYWAILTVDLMAVTFGGAENLEIIKYFLPKKVYDVLNKLFT